MRQPHWTNGIASLYLGDVRDVLAGLPEQSVHTCVTSPPYWGLRDYGIEGQLGLEETPEQYIESMVRVFKAVWRVLRDDGTLWLNLGDSYASNWPSPNRRNVIDNKASAGKRSSRRQHMGNGLKEKDLAGIPWRVALALQADGWYLRSDIIWSKPNPMPESVTDRPTKSHEYLFLLSKSQRYYYDAEAIKEPVTESTVRRLNQDIDKHAGSDRIPGKTNGNMKAVGKNERSGLRRYEGFNERWKNRPSTDLASGMNGHSGFIKADGTISQTGSRNKRTVWVIPTQSYSEAHFATFPEKLVEPCILAGCPGGGVVLDPFIGSGTTCVVAQRLGRKAIGIDINEKYLVLAAKRIASVPLPMPL